MPPDVILPPIFISPSVTLPPRAIPVAVLGPIAKVPAAAVSTTPVKTLPSVNPFMVVVAPTPVLPITTFPVPFPVPMLMGAVLPSITAISNVPPVVPPPIAIEPVLLLVPIDKLPTVAR